MGKTNYKDYFNQKFNEAEANADERAAYVMRQGNKERAQLGKKMSAIEEMMEFIPTKDDLHKAGKAIEGAIVHENARNMADREAKVEDVKNRIGQAENNLAAKIDEQSEKDKLDTMDKLIILVATILSGFVGWLVAQSAIAHNTSSLVYGDSVINYTKDAAGNIIDMTSTNTTNVWTLGVWVTVIGFAIVGYALTRLIVSDISRG